MSAKDELLEKIRQSDGLKNAILGTIVVDKRRKEVVYEVITDRSYTYEEERALQSLLRDFTPEPLKAVGKIVKRVLDEELLKRKIYEYLKKNFPVVASLIEEDGITVQMLSSGANFHFEIPTGQSSFISTEKVLDGICAFLQKGYCGTFYGSIKTTDMSVAEPTVSEETYEEDTSEQPRFFPIENYKRIDGVDTVIPKTAKYIADVDGIENDLTLCGVIEYIEDKESKKGKHYLSLTIADLSGRMRATYFYKKATEEKIRALQKGDSVVLSGANELYGNSISFTAKKINFGNIPEGTVMEERVGKPVPKTYHTVFPEPYVDFTQSDLFKKVENPKCLTDNVFVVFDFETTGLINNPAMGKMDKIIEFGAVKIVGGEIKEKFSSFVHCDEPLSEKIKELTNIKDEDLVSAPTVDKIIPDFFKFTNGALLVGHNVQFDYRFLRYYGEQNGYMFENKTYDTLQMSQSLLAGLLTNYKLDTVADYYGFTFNHHRAFDDALVTAKVFMELVRQKKEL